MYADIARSGCCRRTALIRLHCRPGSQISLPARDDWLIYTKRLCLTCQPRCCDLADGVVSQSCCRLSCVQMGCSSHRRVSLCHVNAPISQCYLSNDGIWIGPRLLGTQATPPCVDTAWRPPHQRLVLTSGGRWPSSLRMIRTRPESASVQFSMQPETRPT